MGSYQVGCIERDRTIGKEELVQRPLNYFSHGDIIVLDYTGYFSGLRTVSDLSGKMQQMIPCKMKRYVSKHREGDSQLIVECLNSEIDTVEFVSFELSLRENGKLLVNIHREASRTQHCGSLECCHAFPEKSRPAALKDFFEWLSTEEFKRSEHPSKALYAKLKALSKAENQDETST